jgi:hypothetical protein
MRIQGASPTVLRDHSITVTTLELSSACQHLLGHQCESPSLKRLKQSGDGVAQARAQSRFSIVTNPDQIRLLYIISKYSSPARQAGDDELCVRQLALIVLFYEVRSFALCHGHHASSSQSVVGLAADHNNSLLRVLLLGC